MDDQNLTAWEEINPAATALVPRPERPAKSSALQPATREEFGTELTACLALVAPVGMDQDARREWLAVAWETLQHLPADMLAHGCRKAREQADHPAKIVPIVIAETRDWLETRRSIARPCPAPLPPERQIEKQEDPMTPEEAAEFNLLCKRFGLKTRSFPDGSCRQLEPGEIDPVQPDQGQE